MNGSENISDFRKGLYIMCRFGLIIPYYDDYNNNNMNNFSYVNNNK